MARIFPALSSRLFVAFFFTLVFSCSAGFTASGETLMDLSIEELMEVKINAASKHEQKLSEAPSSVNIITAEEITRFGYRTLAELLAGERGFFFTNDRNYTYVGVRGFARPGDYNSRFLLLLNGHRVNDNLYYNSQFANDAFLDVDLIDHIEIVRGPSSSLYGSSAFFAIINIIPRTGKQLRGLEVSLGAGSQNSLTSRLSHGGTFSNGQELLLSFTHGSNQGEQSLYFPEFDTPASNQGLARNQDEESFSSAFANYSTGDFSFSAAFNRRAKDVPTGSFGTLFGVPSEHTHDQNLFLDLAYHHRCRSQDRIDGRFFFDQMAYDGSYPYAAGNFADWARGRRIGGEVQFTKVWNKDRKTILGVEINQETQQDQGISLGGMPLLDDHRSSQTQGFYLQEEQAVSKRCLLNLGVRHDIYDRYGNSTNPRFACIYTFSNRTIGKLMYGEAFRVPNVYESFYSDGNNSQKANLRLTPERLKTWELSLDHRFHNGLKGTLTTYCYTLHDLVSQITDPADNLLVFQNGGRIQARGLELEIHRKWNRDLTARLALAVQETTDKQTGVTLSNSPNCLGNLRITYPLFSHAAILGVEERFCGRRTTLQGNTIGGFFLTNMTVTTTSLGHGWSCSIGAYNLFDKAFTDPGAEEHVQDQIRQNGRQFRLKFTKTF